MNLFSRQFWFRNFQVHSHPFFSGETEKHLLRTQIARIAASATICPKGYLVADEAGEITENEELNQNSKKNWILIFYFETQFWSFFPRYILSTKLFQLQFCCDVIFQITNHFCFFRRTGFNFPTSTVLRMSPTGLTPAPSSTRLVWPLTRSLMLRTKRTPKIRFGQKYVYVFQK